MEKCILPWSLLILRYKGIISKKIKIWKVLRVILSPWNSFGKLNNFKLMWLWGSRGGMTARLDE